eukprot:3658226-Amphidinium_carterae.1
MRMSGLSRPYATCLQTDWTPMHQWQLSGFAEEDHKYTSKSSAQLCTYTTQPLNSLRDEASNAHKWLKCPLRCTPMPNAIVATTTRVRPAMKES